MNDGSTMDLRPDMTIGERLKVAREYAGLRQESLAERSGVSIDTIRKLEQGARQGAWLSTLSALATAVGITTAALAEGITGSEERQSTELLAIRRTLIPASDFLPVAGDAEEDTPPNIVALRRSVEDAWGSYHSGNFVTLGRTVPQLLTEARVAAREYTNGEAQKANGILAKASQLGAHVLARGHMEDLALHGLDRARAAAEKSGDPLLAPMLNNSVAWIFMRTGRLGDSEHVAVATADTIEPKFRSSTVSEVSVYGGLLLSAIVAAARHRRYDTARELLGVARAAAARVGEDSTDRWTSVFGPTSVAMQAVGVETAAGEWGTALQLAEKVPLMGQTPDSWKVSFLVDVAYAQSQTHRDEEAVETLKTVRKVAPDWLRRSGLAKSVIREMLVHSRQPRGLKALAKFVGVAH